MIDDNNSTKITLKNYESLGLTKQVVFLFDKANGNYEIINKQKDSANNCQTEILCFGFGALINYPRIIDKHIIAIYSDGEKIVLQLKERKWHFPDPAIRIIWKRIPATFNLFNKFEIWHGDILEFRFQYLNKFFLRFRNYFDITYDSADEDLDDLFKWLGKSLNDSGWASRIKDVWNRGIQ